eukprot:TRINITY_DN136_c1_g1_i2.p1 TRINITY_DN136_c1_g1~~TRINITY_DN136_c1_g1_i2.p1  ORF type:complete len:226 (+),score=37.29 TRINITY_DN136_c1_g1_i2:73-750(+)
MDGECTAVALMAVGLFVVAVVALGLYLRSSDKIRRKDAALDDYARRCDEAASLNASVGTPNCYSSPKVPNGAPPLPIAEGRERSISPLLATPALDASRQRRGTKAAAGRLLAIREGRSGPVRVAYNRLLLHAYQRSRLAARAAGMRSAGAAVKTPPAPAARGGWGAVGFGPGSTSTAAPRPLTFADVMSRRSGRPTLAGFPASPPPHLSSGGRMQPRLGPPALAS